MDRRKLMGCAAAAALMAPVPVVAAPQRKKNFVVIYCDDLGYGDIGPDGNKVIPTPNLDRMAREGTILTNYYAPANLCTPSRAGLLTGRYPIRAGQALMLGPASTTGLPHSNPTIPKALKAAGYVSAQVGKWHLGSTGDFFPPTKYGYDYFYGIPYSHDMWPLSIFEARAGSDVVEKIKPDLKTMQEQFYLHAEKFIEDNAAKPFFVNMSFSAPHLPSWVPEGFKGKSEVGDYGDTIVHIDSLVGRLMAKLDALKLTNDTLIIFTSDNGPWYWGSAGPFRDRKSQPGYDGGYRMPFIARLPGTVMAGRHVDGLASGIDIFPTLCHLAGVAVPAGSIDGVDMSPMLTAGGASARQEIFLFMDEDLVGIRTPRWKYLKNKAYSPNTPAPDRYDYSELYDLQADVSETYNVASRYPDVTAQMAARFAQVKQIYDPMRTRPEKKEPPIHFLGDPAHLERLAEAAMIDRRSMVAGAALLGGTVRHAMAQRIETKPYDGPPPVLVDLAPATGLLRVQVAPGVGAELSGIQCRIGGELRELLYRGRDYRPVKGWTGHAPILWPAVGRNAIASPGGKIGDGPPGWFWKGRHYPMTGHGFARDQAWRLEKSFSGARTAYALVSMADTPATRLMYPFGYGMSVEYRVAASSVILSFRISAAKTNTDAMPFSIGNHMTYNLPFVPTSKADQVTIASSARRNVVLGPGNTPTGQVMDVDFSQPRPLSSLGVQSAYSLAGCRPGDTWVRLEDPAGMAITVSHQSDWRPDGEPVLFNLWGDVGQGFFAPEPWVGKQESLASGDGLIHLPPGEDFNWRIAVDVSFFGALAKA